jgi:hypothetical protein
MRPIPRVAIERQLRLLPLTACARGVAAQSLASSRINTNTRPAAAYRDMQPGGNWMQVLQKKDFEPKG